MKKDTLRQPVDKIEASPENSYRIAVAICSCPVASVHGNLARMRYWVEQAAHQGVELLAFPELNLCGYIRDKRAETVALKLQSPEIEKLVQMAAKFTMVIMAGLVEKGDAGKIYISHLVVHPGGKVEVYRKIHLGPPEKDVFSSGKKMVPVFQHSNLKFGIQLCYDAHFPELSTAMALKGVDLIILPHASPRGTPSEKLDSWLRHLTARAFDNGVYVLAFNPVGENGDGLIFPGVAVFLGPDGKVLTKSTGTSERLLQLDLDLEDLKRFRSHSMRYFLPNRCHGLIGIDAK